MMARTLLHFISIKADSFLIAAVEMEPVTCLSCRPSDGAVTHDIDLYEANVCLTLTVASTI